MTVSVVAPKEPTGPGWRQASEVIDAIEVVGATAVKHSIEMVRTAIVEFDKIAAGLASIEKQHPKDVACEMTTPIGMKQALAGRAAWRAPRIAVEKARVAAKAPVLSLGREIDAFAKRLESRLLEGEANYDGQIKAEEKRREDERAAKEQAERDRVAALRARVDQIAAVALRAVGQTSAEIVRKVALVEGITIDDNWSDFRAAARLTKDETLIKLAELLAAAHAHEAEQQRLADERAAFEAEQRAEAERRAAQARQEAAERAERERLDAEARAAEQERLRAAREAQEADLRAQREEQQRLDREAAAAREAQEAEFAAARDKQARLDAQAAIARAEADREARQKQMRLDAEAEVARTRVAREAREAIEAEQRRIDAERAELKRQQDERERIEREAREAEAQRQHEAQLATRREEAVRRIAEQRLHDAAPRLLAALKTIAAFPITDPKNMDAMNMRLVAVQAVEEMAA